VAAALAVVADGQVVGKVILDVSTGRPGD
jgi:hypothetical protein